MVKILTNMSNTTCFQTQKNIYIIYCDKVTEDNWFRPVRNNVNTFCFHTRLPMLLQLAGSFENCNIAGGEVDKTKMTHLWRSVWVVNPSYSTCIISKGVF